MTYKRVLTMQDISCVGQCSMAVAVAVLSVCSVETCMLPTELLSTHTGGFWKPSVTYLDGSLGPIWRHWKESGIRFDAIYTGYLGSVEAIRTAQTVAQELLEPDGRLIVDPAMADHGKLYSGLDERYAAYMAELCAQADIVLPNLTEGAMLAGMPYCPNPAEGYVRELLGRLPQTMAVLTGVGFQPGQTGVMLKNREDIRHYAHRMVGTGCSGTGDLFAASFVGALMQGKEPFQAVRLAADFTCRCVETTMADPAHWYGVKFEPVLPELMEMLRT